MGSSPAWGLKPKHPPFLGLEAAGLRNELNHGLPDAISLLHVLGLLSFHMMSQFFVSNLYFYLHTSCCSVSLESPNISAWNLLEKQFNPQIVFLISRLSGDCPCSSSLRSLQVYPGWRVMGSQDWETSDTLEGMALILQTKEVGPLRSTGGCPQAVFQNLVHRALLDGSLPFGKRFDDPFMKHLS